MTQVKDKQETTALAVVGDETYAILKADGVNLPAIIAENIGESGLSPFDLDRIKMPSGEAPVWTIPTIDGEDAAREFTGVIVHHRKGRVYWATSLDDVGGGTPPDCSSDDCTTGQGEPGAACHECPFAQFGSDIKSGRGQACKEVHQLFVMLPDNLLPIVVALPPTSGRPARKFLLRLANKALPYYAVAVRFALDMPVRRSR